MKVSFSYGTLVHENCGALAQALRRTIEEGSPVGSPDLLPDPQLTVDRHSIV